MNQSNRNSDRTATPASASTEEPTSTPDTTALAAAKSRRRDLGLDKMCVRILAFVECRGDRVTASQVRRGMNAYRRPQIYEGAIQKLTDIGAIEVEKAPGSRRQWISLLKVPKRFQVTRPKSKRRRHRPRSRGRNPWFELLLAKKTLKKALALWANEVRRARMEDNRRARHRFLADALAIG